MLKLQTRPSGPVPAGQPPSGGCVLKLNSNAINTQDMVSLQPPSGGCVLKLNAKAKKAYGRSSPAAAFGRLCVETELPGNQEINLGAAAFGRLCVETGLRSQTTMGLRSSRLRAAVC